MSTIPESKRRAALQAAQDNWNQHFPCGPKPSTAAAVTVTLPGLEPHHAKDLVVMALNEWRRLRETPNYAEQRYAHMPPRYRKERAERLVKELAAFEQLDVDVLNF